MRNKRSMPTIVEQAILSVDGFEKVYKTFEQQVILKGQSNSTLQVSGTIHPSGGHQ